MTNKKHIFCQKNTYQNVAIKIMFLFPKKKILCFSSPPQLIKLFHDFFSSPYPLQYPSVGIELFLTKVGIELFFREKVGIEINNVINLIYYIYYYKKI